MKTYPVSAAVIGLALGASVLTSTAHAGSNVPSARNEETSGHVATSPLDLRQQKPLVLADESTNASIGWKLGAVLLIGGLCAWAAKTRPARRPGGDVPSLRILGRTSIGVRSELVVVEVDGQRLLLGVTPSTIQNLYIAPLVDDSEVPAREPAEIAPAPRLDRPARDAARKDPTLRPSAAALASPDTLHRHRADVVEGQALGIRAMVERR